MNRKEILEYLNYTGKYTKDVKKRLNKLLKKYHPDNNKDDKDTILILYQIKKELEDGALKYDDSKNEKNTDYSFFIELMIKRLKVKKNKIDKKIELLYEKINSFYEKVNSKQDEIGLIETDIYELEEDISKILRIDMFDSVIVLFILIFVFLLIYLKNFFFIIVIILLVLVEVYYMYIRNSIYLDKKEELKKIKKIKKNVSDEYKNIKDKISVLEKDEVDLKRKRNRINNDISYYSHELSKVKDKELSKDKVMVDENKKSFVKK